MRSETTKDRAGALPPAVYSSQPSCTKVIFHEDSQDHSVTENQEEIKQNMPPVADHDLNVTGVTFVDDSEVAVIAVCEMTPGGSTPNNGLYGEAPPPSAPFPGFRYIKG